MGEKTNKNKTKKENERAKNKKEKETQPTFRRVKITSNTSFPLLMLTIVPITHTASSPAFSSAKNSQDMRPSPTATPRGCWFSWLVVVQEEEKEARVQERDKSGSKILIQNYDLVRIFRVCTSDHVRCGCGGGNVDGSGIDSPISVPSLIIIR